ncbi:MAG: NAD(P)-dependent oxidoreductase [Gammaproteobacteria bacterium]|nr:MAG: NAD(P)-dependent oxidoreductase [Gammaproteobacteria bacterium]
MQKKTVLVTGATGFLGSHVLEALMPNKDIHLIAACRNPSKLLPDFHDEVRQGDLTDSTYIRQLTQHVDVICHAAAWTSLWAHREEEQRYYREPTIALIDAAIASGVQRFIFDSSVVVPGPHRDGTPIGDHESAMHPGVWPHMDIVVDIENYMRKQADRGTTMVSLRCGHFAGARYNLGLLSLMLPRLKTHLVPWVAGGKARVPLVDGRDLGTAYALAATVDGLVEFESFNICGPSFPPMREVIDFLHAEIGVPRPHFGVPLIGAYVFGWLMEKLNPVLPGDPFLTRSIVFLGEDWYAPSDLAQERLGYEPKFDWKTAIRSQLKEMESQGYPRTPLVDGIRWWAR